MVLLLKWVCLVFQKTNHSNLSLQRFTSTKGQDVLFEDFSEGYPELEDGMEYNKVPYSLL